jgi:tetratricopeptide (TPR) repeat protein
VVAAWAAWGATMSLDFERAEELLGVAERAQAALRIRLASVARAQAILALYRQDFEEARRLAQEWVELARKSGDPFELVGGLLTLGGALQITEPTLDAAIATTDEAVRVARASGIDTALVFGLPTLATWLPLEESQRALALLDEATEVTTRIGARLGASHVMGVKARIAARRGDWRTALQGAVDAAAQALELGDHALVSRSLSTAGVALCALGSSEAAAVLFGKADAIQERWGPDTTLEMLAATDTALLEILGEQQVVTLAARGAALDITDAVAYLRTEADRALAAP